MRLWNAENKYESTTKVNYKDNKTTSMCVFHVSLLMTFNMHLSTGTLVAVTLNNFNHNREMQNKITG